jgi:hypothetical protein
VGRELGQQSEERALRKRPHHLRRIEKPDLTRRPREHADRVLNPPEGPDYFRTLLAADARERTVVLPGRRALDERRDIRGCGDRVVREGDDAGRLQRAVSGASAA